VASKIMKMNPALFMVPIVLVSVLVIAVLSYMWSLTRSRKLLEQWAAGNGYNLLLAERRLFWLGPFWWHTSKGQVVFHVTVRDQEGRERSGWVRVGSHFGGLFSDKTEVRWKKGAN
jgi:hypothetical protein